MFRTATIAAVVAVAKLGTASFVETKLCSLSEPRIQPPTRGSSELRVQGLD